MRLLADENFPGISVKSLRDGGHDISWIRETSPGITDEQVIQIASVESRILLTFDKDFGELAFRRGISSASGIILFRITGTNPLSLSNRIDEVLNSRADWQGHFSVVETSRIRMRRIL